MKNLFFILIGFYTLSSFSQNEDIINPKGKWYIGIESGMNIITSYELSEPNLSAQGGFSCEYYISKQWSILGKIKYYKTGLSFGQLNSNQFSWKDKTYQYGKFEGNVIAVPLYGKWDCRIYKNLKGHLKLGVVASFETKSNYIKYIPEIENEFDKVTLRRSFGTGFYYFLDIKNIVFLDIENVANGPKGEVNSFIFGNITKSATNILVSFGYKHQF